MNGPRTAPNAPVGHQHGRWGRLFLAECGERAWYEVSSESKGGTDHVMGDILRCHVRHFQLNSSHPVTRRRIGASGSCGTPATVRPCVAPHRSQCSFHQENRTALGDADNRQGPDGDTVGKLDISDPLPDSCGRFTDNPANHSAARSPRSREFP